MKKVACQKCKKSRWTRSAAAECRRCRTGVNHVRCAQRPAIARAPKKEAKPEKEKKERGGRSK